VGKAHLEAMAIRPPIERPNTVSDEVLGYFMVAYYGGRTECRIRRVPLPVRYVDFTSMYPSVFVLLGLWDWGTADHFEAEDATEEARAFLASATRVTLHDPQGWLPLAGVVCRVRPSGELLPVRARYAADPGTGLGNPAWTIGLNHLTSSTDLWFTRTSSRPSSSVGARPRSSRRSACARWAVRRACAR
jgi:hypothetical protein